MNELKQLNVATKNYNGQFEIVDEKARLAVLELNDEVTKLVTDTTELNEKLVQQGEAIANFGGTVEITSGEPTKENTVVTINPNSETTNVYTAEEVDDMFNQLFEGKADRSYVDSMFEQLKQLIQNGTVESDVDSVQISQTVASMFVGDTLQLSANVLPIDAVNTNIKWKSSDSSVASVNNTGLVTALKMGNVVISATSESDETKTATCVINITYSTEETVLDMDFTNHTIQDYINAGVVTLGDSTISELTYNEDGLVCNDTDLRYGLKLTNPIDVSGAWYVEITAKIKPYDESGTTVDSAKYVDWAILSGVDSETDNHEHSNACLSPCITDVNEKANIRLRVSETTSREVGSFFLHDGLEHTYRIEKDSDETIRLYRDDVKIRETDFEEGSSGYFEYVFGIHKGYKYEYMYSTEKGITIKNIKVEKIDE